MRTLTSLASVLALLALSRPLAAQNILGNAPSLQFKAIDTSKAIKPPDMSKFTIVGQPRTPNLTGFMPNFSFMQGRWPATAASTPILTGKNNPFQPNPPKGYTMPGAPIVSK